MLAKQCRIDPRPRQKHCWTSQQWHPAWIVADAGTAGKMVWTQKRVAAELGVSQKTVSNWFSNSNGTKATQPDDWPLRWMFPPTEVDAGCHCLLAKQCRIDPHPRHRLLTHPYPIRLVHFWRLARGNQSRGVPICSLLSGSALRHEHLCYVVGHDSCLTAQRSANSGVL